MPIKLITTWKSSQKKKILQATTFSKLIKPIKKSNSPQEPSLQSQTSLKLSSFVLNNTVKELSINSVKIPDVLPTHQQDGSQVPSPISWQKSSKSQDFWSSLTQRMIDKPFLRLHTSISQLLPFAILTLHWISSISLFHATTESQKPSLWSSGC